EALRAVGKQFNLHPLVLEDIASTAQRPKIEEYDHYLFIVLRVPVLQTLTEDDTSAEVLATCQLALCVVKEFVLTFQEEDEAALAPVRKRLMQQKGKLYQRGPDYLAYALLDAVIDTFFPLLERYVERIEELEAAVMEMDDNGGLNIINWLTSELVVSV